MDAEVVRRVVRVVLPGDHGRRVAGTHADVRLWQKSTLRRRLRREAITDVERALLAARERCEDPSEPARDRVVVGIDLVARTQLAIPAHGFAESRVRLEHLDHYAHIQA